MSALDVAVGASGLALGAAAVLGRRAGSRLAPAARLALRPPRVSRRFQPARLVDSLGQAGADWRRAGERELERLLDAVVPVVLDQVLARVDLTDLVLRYVDLDTVVEAVDVEAVVRRVDVDAVVSGVDLDAIVSRVDVDAVLDRLDLTATVLNRVDLQTIVSHVDVESVVARVDVDGIARRLDLDAVAERLDVEAVLDRLDLTAIVLQRVDLDVLVHAILARIDLVALAEEVIDGVDLPGIIRESTGTMASDTVRGARMQGIAADEAVGRAVDRLLLRRARRHAQAPGQVTPAGPDAQDGRTEGPSGRDYHDRTR